MPRRRRYTITGFFEDRIALEKARQRRALVLAGDASYDNLTPTDFEAFIADVFRRQGCLVREIGGAGDLGIDLEIRKGGALWVAQCKKFSQDRPVGPEIIREFASAIQQAGALQGYLVTTSYFTRASLDAAKYWNILLVDRVELDRMVRQAQRSPQYAAHVQPIGFFGLHGWQAVVLLIGGLSAFVCLSAIACAVLERQIGG